MMGPKDTQIAPPPGRFAGHRRTRRALLCASVTALALVVSPTVASACTVVDPPNPWAAARSASAISATGATLEGAIEPNCSPATYRFEYGPDGRYESSAPPGEGSLEALPEYQRVFQTIGGLTPGTLYFYRLVATNEFGSSSSYEETFTTLPIPPAVQINPAGEVPGGVELSGSVDPYGGETTYSFEYGPTSSYGSKSVEQVLHPGAHAYIPVEAEIKANLLVPGQQYDFRLSAENSAGRSESQNLTFTAPEIEEAPLAIVNPPGQTSRTASTLVGYVNPRGLPSTYRFELGKTTAYGMDLPAGEGTVPAGEGPVAVEAPATGLEPNTTYHYRLLAKNAKGEAESPDEAFTTLPEPPLATATPYTETAQGYLLNGIVNPNGVKTTYYFEYGIAGAYGLKSSAWQSAGAGTAPMAVSEAIGPLPPDSPFEYRLVATSAGGETKSNSVSFTTPSEPQGKGSQASAISLDSIAVKGTRASIWVEVPGLGTISASGRGLRRASAHSLAAGPLKLGLALNRAGIRRLRRARRHRLGLAVQIGFRPLLASDTPASIGAKLLFRAGGSSAKRG